MLQIIQFLAPSMEKELYKDKAVSTCQKRPGPQLLSSVITAVLTPFQTERQLKSSTSTERGIGSATQSLRCGPIGPSPPPPVSTETPLCVDGEYCSSDQIGAVRHVNIPLPADSSRALGHVFPRTAPPNCSAICSLKRQPRLPPIRF